MKRILILLFVFVLPFMVFAEGQQEEEKPLIFSIVSDASSEQWPDRGFKGYLWKDNIIPKFEEETGIKIELRQYSDKIDNTATSLDMDLASGEPSDVIWSYGGRVNKFANADFGINLYEALPKEFIAQFKQSALSQFERDGKLYALPMPGWAVCLIANRTLFKQAGVADILPADDDLDRSWTIAEFDRAIKAITALGDDYYGYYIIAKECGGDYWILNMLDGFGANLYENGRATLNTPEGIKGMEYIHYLHENGYVPYGASGLYDGDMGMLFGSGKLGIMGSVPYGVELGKIAARDGAVEEEFECVLLEYPHVEGIDGVAPCFGPDLAMVIDNDDPIQLEKALKFLQYITGAEVQTILQKVYARFSPLKTAGMPTSSGIIGNAMKQMAQIIKKRGIYDMGIGFPVYNELRQIWLAILQGMLINEITPAEAAAEFDRRANKLLSE
ncbi:hypothetical protein ES708_08016 [subsurface metagenome]